jgi:hypothetical protein
MRETKLDNKCRRKMLGIGGMRELMEDGRTREESMTFEVAVLEE